MLGGAKIRLIVFHILVLIMLYGLVTSTVGFLLVEAMNLQSFQAMVNNISEVLCSSRQQYSAYVRLGMWWYSLGLDIVVIETLQWCII